MSRLVDPNGTKGPRTLLSRLYPSTGTKCPHFVPVGGYNRDKRPCPPPPLTRLAVGPGTKATYCPGPKGCLDKWPRTKACSIVVRPPPPRPAESAWWPRRRRRRRPCRGDACWSGRRRAAPSSDSAKRLRTRDAESNEEEASPPRYIYVERATGHVPAGQAQEGVEEARRVLGRRALSSSPISVPEQKLPGSQNG